jgi:hypothetical protein
MTDDVTPYRVPVRSHPIDSRLMLTTLCKDPYKSFLRVSRIWDHLTSRVRSGFTHGLNALLPPRPEKAIISYCPACPEPGVNMFDGWKLTPDELKCVTSFTRCHSVFTDTFILHSYRHINTLFLAMDGNHRSNRFTKNTDPKDLSLWEGVARGYFPGTHAYSDYLKEIPVTKEVSFSEFSSANI